MQVSGLGSLVDHVAFEPHARMCHDVSAADALRLEVGAVAQQPPQVEERLAAAASSLPISESPIAYTTRAVTGDIAGFVSGTTGTSIPRRTAVANLGATAGPNWSPVRTAI